MLVKRWIFQSSPRPTAIQFTRTGHATLTRTRSLFYLFYFFLLKWIYFVLILWIYLCVILVRDSLFVKLAWKALTMKPCPSIVWQLRKHFRSDLTFQRLRFMLRLRPLIQQTCNQKEFIWTKTLKKDAEVLISKQGSRLFSTNQHTSGSGEETGPMTYCHIYFSIPIIHTIQTLRRPLLPFWQKPGVEITISEGLCVVYITAVENVWTLCCVFMIEDARRPFSWF